MTSYLPQPHNDGILVKIIFLASGHFNRVHPQNALDISRVDGDLHKEGIRTG